MCEKLANLTRKLNGNKTWLGLIIDQILTVLQNYTEGLNSFVIVTEIIHNVNYYNPFIEVNGVLDIAKLSSAVV